MDLSILYQILIGAASGAAGGAVASLITYAIILPSVRSKFKCRGVTGVVLRNVLIQVQGQVVNADVLECAVRYRVKLRRSIGLAENAHAWFGIYRDGQGLHGAPAPWAYEYRESVDVSGEESVVLLHIVRDQGNNYYACVRNLQMRQPQYFVCFDINGFRSELLNITLNNPVPSPPAFIRGNLSGDETVIVRVVARNVLGHELETTTRNLISGCVGSGRNEGMVIPIPGCKRSIWACIRQILNRLCNVVGY
ncbi:hypothetical protein [Vulcanisaeta thermophila]|uniref:hypothetical protein n=1 Tax=Vulcanisaeta thermophila TaxID=867917 RepID=UPI000853B989|nr:hypothetical protein [Vulcanisaeta thermophila]